MQKQRYKRTHIGDRFFQVHRVAWESHYGPVPEGCYIHHIDKDIHNNDINNLQCVTSSEHAKLHGWQPPRMRGRLFTKGNVPPNRPAANVELVPLIRRYLQDGWRVRDIVSEFGVSRYLVSDVKSGRSYAGVL